MSRQYLMILGVTVLVLCGRSGAQVSRPSADTFVSDTRLDQRVTLRVEGLPVVELLTTLSEKTGVKLSVQPNIGDEKIVIFNAARSRPFEYPRTCFSASFM